MKLWEDRKTVEKFRKMNGDETVKLGMELTKSYLESLKKSIRRIYPHISRKKLFKAVNYILWELDPSWRQDYRE